MTRKVGCLKLIFYINNLSFFLQKKIKCTKTVKHTQNPLTHTEIPREGKVTSD